MTAGGRAGLQMRVQLQVRVGRRAGAQMRKLRCEANLNTYYYSTVHVLLPFFTPEVFFSQERRFCQLAVSA